MGPLHRVVLLSALQAGQSTLVTGTLNDRPAPEAGMRTRTELKPSDDRDLIENRYRILGFPTLILLDPDGVVVEIGGSIARMMPTLEHLLEKR